MPPQPQQIQTTVIPLAWEIVARQLLIQLQILNNSANRAALGNLIAAARNRDLNFDLDAIPLHEIGSLRDLIDKVGDLGDIVNILQTQKDRNNYPIITQQQAAAIFRQEQHERFEKNMADLVVERMRPEWELRYHNLFREHTDTSYVNEETRRALQAKRNQISQAEQSGASTQTLRNEEQEIIDDWNTVRVDVPTYQRLVQIHNQLPTASAKQRKQLEQEAREIERRAVDEKINYHGKVLPKITRAAAVAQHNEGARQASLRRRPRLYNAHQQAKGAEKTILDQVKNKRENIPTEHQDLHFEHLEARRPIRQIPGRPLTQEAGLELKSDAMQVAYNLLLDPAGGLDPAKTRVPKALASERIAKLPLVGRIFTKKSPIVVGAERAEEQWSVIRDTEKTLRDSIKFELDKVSNDTVLNESVAADLAQKLAYEAAQHHQNLLEDEHRVHQGVHTAGYLPLEYLTENPDSQREIAHAMIQSQLETMTAGGWSRSQALSQAAGNAGAWLEPVLQAIKNAPAVPTKKVDFEIRNKDRALVKNEETFLPIDERVVQGRSHIAATQSPLDAARAFNRAFLTRKRIRERGAILDDLILGARDEKGRRYKEVRETRLARQAAFTQGVLDAEKLIRENPELLSMAGVSRFGLTVGVLPHLAYALAPDSLRNAGAVTKGGLLYGALSLPLVPVGPFAFPIAAHVAGQELKEEFRRRYGDPYLNTVDWWKAYTEGQIKQTLAVLFPGVLKYDKKGRVGIGVGQVFGAWQTMWNSVGSLLKGKYNRNLLRFRSDEKGGGMNALKRNRRNLGQNLLKILSKRYQDEDARRDPISLMIIAPLWALAKAGVISVLETTAFLPGLRYSLQTSGMGDLAAAWNTGGGWASQTRIFEIYRELEKEAVAKLPMGYADPNLNKVRAGVQARVNRLQRVGNFAKGLSRTWEFGKILGNVAFRGTAITFISMLAGAPLPLAIGIGASYSIPWGIGKVLTTPKLAGRYVWGAQGGYAPGLLGKHNAFARLAKAINTPLTRLGDETLGLSRRMKLAGGLGRFIPWNGIWMGLLLSQFNLPIWAAWGVPLGVDLGIKIFKEVTKELGRFQSVLGPTGYLAKFSSIFGTIFQTGSLAYAMKEGLWGEHGLFALFTQKFSIPNLVRFLQLPGAYLSFLGLFALFPSLALGLPLGIAAGLATGTVVIADQVLRHAFHYQGGLWEFAFQPAVTGIWNFLKDKGLVAAYGAASIIIGLFGMLQAALKGDIQSLLISLIFTFAGIGFISYSGSTFPASYYTPAGAGAVETPEPPDEVPSNDYIKNAEKEIVSKTENTLTYNFRYEVKVSGEEINVTEEDIFESIDLTDILSVEPAGLFVPQSNDGHLSLYKSYTTSQTSINQTFTITLSQPLENYVDSNGQFCNTLTIKTDPAADQNIVQRKCIDASGTPVTPPISGDASLPVAKGQGVRITVCFNPPIHSGLDIGTGAAPDPNVPVYAVWDGKVIVAGRDDSYGDNVVIQHSNGKTTLYAHLKEGSIAVSKGEEVSAGQTIGKVDETGHSKGNHLHFEVREGTKRTNPCEETDLNLCTTYPYKDGVPQCT